MTTVTSDSGNIRARGEQSEVEALVPKAARRLETNVVTRPWVVIAGVNRPSRNQS